MVKRTRKKITKFISFNLLGETSKEEKKRLLKARIKLILKGKSKLQVKNISKLAGTTSLQRAFRLKILKKSGLKSVRGKLIKMKVKRRQK